MTWGSVTSRKILWWALLCFAHQGARYGFLHSFLQALVVLYERAFLILPKLAQAGICRHVARLTQLNWTDCWQIFFRASEHLFKPTSFVLRNLAARLVFHGLPSIIARKSNRNELIRHSESWVQRHHLAETLDSADKSYQVEPQVPIFQPGSVPCSMGQANCSCNGCSVGTQNRPIELQLLKSAAVDWLRLELVSTKPCKSKENAWCGFNQEASRRSETNIPNQFIGIWFGWYQSRTWQFIFVLASTVLL